MLFNVDGALFLQTLLVTCHKGDWRERWLRVALFLGPGWAVSGISAPLEGAVWGQGLHPRGGGPLLSLVPEVDMYAWVCLRPTWSKGGRDTLGVETLGPGFALFWYLHHVRTTEAEQCWEAWRGGSQ